MISLLLAASMCGDCGVHRQQFIVQQHVGAIQALPIAVWQVAPEVRSQALAYKSDPLYKEFMEFKKWKENQHAPTKTEPVRKEVTVGGNLLEATCGRCHTGANPAGGFSFNGKFRMQPETFEKVTLWLTGAVKPPGKMAGVIEGIRKDKDKHIKVFTALSQLQATKFQQGATESKGEDQAPVPPAPQVQPMKEEESK